MKARTSRHSGKRAFVVPVLAGALLLIMVILPVDLALSAAGSSGVRLPHGIASAAALLGLLALAVLLGPLGAWVVTVVLLLALVIRALYAGLLHFSGQGFTDEVFLHLEPEAVSVAWSEYDLAILLLLAGLGLAALLSAGLAFRLRSIGRKRALVVMLLALPVLAWSGSALPEAQLGAALSRWYFPRTLPLAEERLARWRDSALLELDLVPKNRVFARAPEQARNLILLFIESGGAALARHPGHRGLMPNLRTLLDQHSLVPDFHASAYITIEGLVNAMCGTLFPFQADSDELASSERLAEWMPCLGDVLRAAGYEQSYMGGASLAFAGKGAFLKAHGYDRLKGIDEWRAIGLSERKGTWGLSDADLFEQSHAEIAELRATGSPFHLTLLTIGMHVPGYAYEECTPYGDGSERFLNAVSCTDQLLDRWLRRLEEDGVLDDTLVVITADHHVFANPEMRRLFGNQAVLDRRLPLVVLGAEHKAASAEGASYDLAPTLLDLLGIEHNARFALGRSLLDPAASRSGFFRKYENIVHGTASENAHCEQPGTGVPAVPLSGCDKQELMQLLAMQNQSFSLGPSVLRCDGTVGANRLFVPSTTEEPFSFLLAGREQAHRFTRNSRSVDPRSPGLYIAVFGSDGALVDRRYAAPSEAADLPFPDDPGAAGVLALWRGAEESGSARPTWLPGGATSQAWLFRAGDAEPVAEGFASEGAVNLVLGPSACHLLSAAAPH